MKLKVEVISDKGLVREHNEDEALVCGDFYRDESFVGEFDTAIHSRFTALVADGMGGTAGGELASDMSLLSFDDFITDLPDDLSPIDFRDQVEAWVQQCHQEIITKGYELPQFCDMGTTLVGIFCYEDHLYSINVGDSRLYRFRNGQLKPFSVDHSMRNLKNDNSLPSNLMYNCFGGGDGEVFADIADISTEWESGDLWLVCSDGLSDLVTDQHIESLLPLRSASALVEAAKEAGGRDNITVILVQVV